MTSMAEAIEAVVNKIPGVEIDMTSGLHDFQRQIADMADKVKSESEWTEVMGTLDYMDPKAAMESGYAFGEGIDESIANFDLSSLFDTPVPGAGDYADLSGYGAGLAGDVGDIAGNTGAIKDSMDITEEDLKYLRDIAEQEAINRFTTAEINIEAPITNQISKDVDLDGVVDGLTGAVNEAADIIAEGVHE